MRQRDISWTVALCLSLAVHAAVIRWRAEAYVAAHSPLRLPGFARTLLADPVARPQPDAEALLGDEKGIGYATDASPGDLELLARKADQDQTYLSRDPQSLGQVGAPPSPMVNQPGENGANGSRSSEDASAAQNNHPFGLQQTAQVQPAFKTPAEKDHGPGPAPHPDAPPARQPTPPTVAASSQQPAPPTVAQNAATPVSVLAYHAPSGRPGTNAPPASLAPQGDSDSDPFAVVGSMEFRPGSTKIQCGRKHKITRPKLSWDTVYDFQSMMSASVTLELQLDETGHVINSAVIKSSGSNSIDQPCRIAAYDWWFEPAKDATGKPTKDVIKFTIKFF
jgi:TonB family protein